MPGCRLAFPEITLSLWFCFLVYTCIGVVDKYLLSIYYGSDTGWNKTCSPETFHRGTQILNNYTDDKLNQNIINLLYYIDIILYKRIHWKK